MFLEVISNNEALLEVRVKAVFYFLSAAEELPMTLLRICLVIQEADWIRDTLADAIHIFEFPALDEKLHFEAKRLF